MYVAVQKSVREIAIDLLQARFWPTPSPNQDELVFSNETVHLYG